MRRGSAAERLPPLVLWHLLVLTLAAADRLLLMLLPVVSSLLVATFLWRTAAARSKERVIAQRLSPGPDGVIPGAAPIRLDAGAGTHAVLLIHGFGDTPQTLGYLAHDLHARGYIVHAPLLPGHGRTLRAFADSRAADWLDAARAELHALRGRADRVGVVGLSLGGAIATILAAETPDLPALALIAPYLDAPLIVRRLARWHVVVGAYAPYLPRGGDRSIHDAVERSRSLSHGTVTSRLLRELVSVADLAHAALPRVSAPTILIQSRDDNRIAPAVAERALERLGAREKRLEWLTGCGHVLTVDCERERVFALVGEWLAAHLGMPAWVGGPGSAPEQHIETL